MTRKTMSSKEAKRFARSQFENALKQLHQAKAIYDQVVDQRPKDISLAQERWILQGHLNAIWEYYSQYGQDKFVYEMFFQDRRDGFFLDVGAHDGITGSNSLFFERSLGWQGLCIEASPSQFDALQKSRRTRCLDIAVGDSEGTEPFLEIVNGYTQMGGLVRELRKVDHVRQNPRHQEREISIVVRPLSDVLNEYGITVVDYCSIDVEGAELRVLKGIDFERHQISVFSIENAYHYAPQRNREIKDYMESVGYCYIDTLGHDEVYARPGLAQ